MAIFHNNLDELKSNWYSECYTSLDFATDEGRDCRNS